MLAGVVVLMWVIEAINTLDSNNLDSDGILPRSIDHLWGIFTAPFIHASWQHLIANTVPFVFMGLIIALQGAKRFALVTLIVIVVGGIGTWLVSRPHLDRGPEYTIGASGVVFGYATYLFTRGFFNRNILELLIGLVVGVIWGGALYVERRAPHRHLVAGPRVRSDRRGRRRLPAPERADSSAGPGQGADAARSPARGSLGHASPRARSG